MTGVGPYYQDQQQERYQCLDCGVDLTGMKEMVAGKEMYGAVSNLTKENQSIIKGLKKKVYTRR